MAEHDWEVGRHPNATEVACLLQAVARSRSWRGVVRVLGARPSETPSLQAQCDRLGIDYGHFRSRRWTDTELRHELAGARSWRQLLHALGYRDDSGSARATVRKHAVRLGLDLGKLDDVPRPAAPDPFSNEVEPNHLRAAGAYLVAGACALRGFKVSWPLEPAVYDLLVDTGTALLRVQVKTTTWRLDGAFACKITRGARGVKTWYTATEIDYFGIVDGDQQIYMIPVEVVEGIGTIIVRHYAAYRINSALSLAIRPDELVGPAGKKPIHEPLL